MVEDNKTYLLDTNVVIQMLRGDRKMLLRINDEGISNCCISEITIAELYYGAVKGNRQSNFDDIKTVMDIFRIVPLFDSYEQLARIRLHLRSIGKMIDAYDMMIGATAVNGNYVLVTHNIKHYQNIPDIVLVDWQV